MVLESTMICVDNSDFMRNGDFLPTRLQAQQDAVNLVCHSKTRSNPENNVGLLAMADSVEVLATLTSDCGRILSKLHQVQPNGNINFMTGIRIAHLALKHRQGKNHKMRIIAFVGSPVELDEKELTKLAKRLKKEKVNVDIVSFGEEVVNSELLNTFISTLNGKDGAGSHMVTVAVGPHLSDALISSPIIQGEDGAGGAPGSAYEFGVDPNEDPELALALRVSMEEQRARQESEARRAADGASADPKASESVPVATSDVTAPAGSEEAMLERALAMSMDTSGPAPARATSAGQPDFAQMTEEEQIAFAMQMSMQDSQEPAATSSDAAAAGASSTEAKAEPMETDEMVNDPAFLQSVLENLPGVDPQSAEVRHALSSSSDKEKKKEVKKEKK
uniref:26S proteasome non-ATPase regulatory subunit 4 n=1 Tax=Cacopsylla melanoneura TaxID=428564 RepID=A0A8D8LDS5_9HEMI